MMLQSPLGSDRTLPNQLSLLGVALPAWPEETETTAGRSTVDVAQGLAHADGLRQWRQQLVRADESTRSLVTGFLAHRLEVEPFRGWDGWVAVVILSDLREPESLEGLMRGGTGLRPDELSPSQLIGAALSLIEDRQISTAALVLSWLRQRTIATEAWRFALAETILSRQGENVQSQPRPENSVGQWLEAVRNQTRVLGLLQALVRVSEESADPPFADLKNLANSLRCEERQSAQRLNPGSLMVWIAEGNRRILTGDREGGYRLLRDLLAPDVLQPPSGADGNAWHQLVINAASRPARGSIRLALIESKSLPRTGHHHLRQLLQNAHGNDFSCCELYQEPGCCQKMPCNAEPWWSQARTLGHDHVRLIKSHDYSLNDPAYHTLAGVVRLVQVRRPFPLLASWLELKHLHVNREMLERHGIDPKRIYLYHEAALVESSWRLIDEFGTAMKPDLAVQWLGEKTTYIIGFLNKWLPLSSPLPAVIGPTSGTFLLRYEDLGVQSSVLRSIGGFEPETDPADARTTCYRPREGNYLRRSSLRISALLNQLETDLMHCEAVILRETARWQHLLGYIPTTAGS